MPEPVLTPDQRNDPSPRLVALQRNTGTVQLSPSILRRTRCSCTITDPDLVDPQDLIDPQLVRLDKVWQRTTSSQLPRQVRTAGERICHHLRVHGWELAHLTARVNAESSVDLEISILWLVPVPGEETGHRFLAELLIQFCGQGKHGGAIENVAVRYAGYWNDWTVSLPNEYYPVEGIQAEGTEDWRIRIPKDGTVRDQMIHDKVWMEAVCLLTGEAYHYHRSWSLS